MLAWMGFVSMLAWMGQAHPLLYTNGSAGKAYIVVDGLAPSMPSPSCLKKSVLYTILLVKICLLINLTRTRVFSIVGDGTT